MKSFSTVTAFALVAAASARPSSRLSARDGTCILATQSNPINPQIANAIKQWNADVNSVNDFANNAYNLDGPTLKSAAQDALASLQDESCQLGTLYNVLNTAGSDAASCALADLPGLYSTIEFNLNQIIADPSDQENTMDNLETFNALRCCNVIGDLGILWADAAAEGNVKGQVPVEAGQPNMCSTIDCSAYTQLDSTKCISKDDTLSK